MSAVRVAETTRHCPEAEPRTAGAVSTSCKIHLPRAQPLVYKAKLNTAALLPVKGARMSTGWSSRDIGFSGQAELQ